MSHYTGKQLTRLEEATGKRVEFATWQYADEIVFKFDDGTFLFGEIVDDCICFGSDIGLRRAVSYNVASPEGIQESEAQNDRRERSAEAQERITYERLKAKFEGGQSSQ